MVRTCPRCGTSIRGLTDECPGCGLDQPVPMPWYYVLGMFILLITVAWTAVDFDKLTYLITQFGPMRIGN